MATAEGLKSHPIHRDNRFLPERKNIAKIDVKYRAMKRANDKRQFSPEGFMLADAVLTQVGDLPYTRGELGMDGNPSDIITLRRTRQVLEEALPSMKGAPVTIGHPERFIGTGDAKKNVVGAIVSTPTIDASGKVRASVRLFDNEAISMVRGGDDQLSPGFNFVPTNLTDDGGDISQMSVNHVAIVPKGRAGEAVRILDHLPPNIGINTESNTMEHAEISAVVRAAVDAAMKESAKPGMSSDDVTKAVGDSIAAALKPVIEDVSSLKEKQAKDEAAAEAKKAEDAAKAEKDQIIDEVMKAERVRYQIVQDATPFIAEDQRDGLLDKSAKEILTLAVGDSVDDAANCSDDMLRGVLLGMMKAAKDQASVEVGDAMVTRTPKSDTKAKDVYKERYNKSRGIKEDM